MSSIVPVRRAFPVSIARDAVAARCLFGVVHDPAGCYTVGPFVIPNQDWQGAFALLAWTGRADHTRERVITTDEDDRPALAARLFVDAVGADAAMEACRTYDERHAWA